MNKRFGKQPAAVTVGIFVAVCLLAGIMLASEIGLTALEERVMPLLEEGVEAAQRGDAEGALRLAERIDACLREAEPTLMLIANHRDLMEMLEASGRAAMLGGDGAENYIEAFSLVRSKLRLIFENNDLTVGNIL